MPDTFPQLYLIRHGETEWTVSKQHTSKTDLPLLEKGESDALKVGRRLETVTFSKILSSPRQRAIRTAELAGFGHLIEINDDLSEWDYGDYEGLTSLQIRKINPNWNLFTKGCPGGETPENITIRADRVIQKIRSSEKNTAIFSHGHFLRVLAIRWIGLPVIHAASLTLATSSISILGYENRNPAIMQWNCKYTED